MTRRPSPARMSKTLRQRVFIVDRWSDRADAYVKLYRELSVSLVSPDSGYGWEVAARAGGVEEVVGACRVAVVTGTPFLE